MVLVLSLGIKMALSYRAKKLLRWFYEKLGKKKSHSPIVFALAWIMYEVKSTRVQRCLWCPFILEFPHSCTGRLVGCDYSIAKGTLLSSLSAVFFLFQTSRMFHSENMEVIALTVLYLISE